MSLIAAKWGKRIVAALVFCGSANSDFFKTWLQACLFPRIPKNALVIMDNARFHKTKEVQEVFNQSAVQSLFLPPYSPDLNPIEKVFGGLKKIREYQPEETSVYDLIKLYKFKSD